MRMKFLSFHVIPWCFRMMGKRISCVQFDRVAVGHIKVIKCDGLVKIYHRPVKVSELMAQFPKHMVCRSDTIYIGHKIPALSEDECLELDHNYFLLPKHFFQCVLSFVTLASFASYNDSDAGSESDKGLSKSAFLKKAATCQAFDIQKTPSGVLKLRVSEEFIAQLMEEQQMKEEVLDDDDEKRSVSRVCTTPQLQKDYAQLVGQRREWKPKLEMIKESRKEKRKVSKFGMRRKKKSHESEESLIGLSEKLEMELSSFGMRRKKKLHESEESRIGLSEKLEMVKESKKEKRKFSSFRIKRKKKSQSQPQSPIGTPKLKLEMVKDCRKEKRKLSSFGMKRKKKSQWQSQTQSPVGTSHKTKTEAQIGISDLPRESSSSTLLSSTKSSSKSKVKSSANKSRSKTKKYTSESRSL